MERYAARQMTNSLLDRVEETLHSILVMPVIRARPEVALSKWDDWVGDGNRNHFTRTCTAMIWTNCGCFEPIC